ncbi:type IX secretion system sortase PorU [Algoriphagus aestuarii]|nr:type IX secretion system sortase PorU [Algoriphagus aestuarii]
MKTNLRKKIILFYLSLFISWNSYSQSRFFSFTITEPGIYQLNQETLSKLGATSANQISIYGYPGMLPHVLEPEQLELQEIPVSVIGENVFFFLEGPHVFNQGPENNWAYRHHLYSDSLNYLIEVGKAGRKIETQNPKGTNLSASTLFQFRVFKGEEKNILNSGKTWYSEPVFPGSSRTIPVFTETDNSQPWKLFGNLMASAKSPSTLEILADQKPVFNQSFDPVPSTTYGIKGIEKEIEMDMILESSKLDRIRITFQSSDLNGSAYWDFLVLGIPFTSDPLNEGIYYNWNPNPLSLSPRADLSYWDISDFHNPIQLDFTEKIDVNLSKIIAFDQNRVEKIQTFKEINLGIQEKPAIEFLIVSPKSFSFAAEKLKQHKNSMGISTEVVYLADIYQTFGYGNKDLVAIRNFIASRFHPDKTLRNVLIFGKGTFDYKGKLGGRPNLIPIYTSNNSLNPLTSYSSDDFYGLLEYGQGEWKETKDGDERVQIGIGRIPVINSVEALQVVNKIIEYETKPEAGFWKRKLTFLVDDGDNNIHMRDAERHATYLTDNYPGIRLGKLYLDNFEQEQTGERQRSPKTKLAFEKTLEEGTLVLNYIGHGNETTLTAEEVFNVSDIENWAKQKKPALWVTATCEFGRHDSPFIRSAAEELLTAEGKGAIALFSTGRPVFSSVNFSINEAFIQELFKKVNNKSQDLGNIYKNTKNNSLNGPLNRNFSLIGDPSLRLAEPDLGIRISSVLDSEGNHLEYLPRGRETILEGEIIDPLTESTQIGYHGMYQIEIPGNDSNMKTLGDENPSFQYKELKEFLFRGKGDVRDGRFTSRIFLPTGNSEEELKSQIRMIARSTETGIESFGMEKKPARNNPELSSDHVGPEIHVYFNGNEPSSRPVPSQTLLTKIDLSDISGIDISGQTPGQEIKIQLNGGDFIILNDDFIANASDYKKGSLEFLLMGLNEGENQILIEAWDNLGNQSILTVTILVSGSEKLKILKHFTYPNPTDAVSNFLIEHNRPGETLQVTISVFQTTGQAIFTESRRLIKASARIDDISWIFLQNQTKYPAKGTYIYKITLQSETDNSMAVASGQLVIK